LQYATNTKLKHDSRRNKIIDSCITGMDGLVGEMDAAIVNYIEKKTTNAKNEPVISFASDFKDVYNSVFDENETELGNVSDLVKQYEAN
jgi:succinate dehydrogenase flavin-adding protein (antitoxin of CptAB toxin-antitoxin module)